MNLTSGFIGAAAATLVIGGLLALQPPINSELGKRTSALGAAFVSVAITTVVLGLILLAFGDPGSLRRITEVPAIYLTGGLYGAAFVAVSLITVRTLGAGALIAVLITGELIVGALLDHFGAFGLEEVALSPTRFIGIAALLFGTVMMSLEKL